MATYSWNKHGIMFLYQFKGIVDPPGWKIDQIWAKIIENIEQISKKSSAANPGESRIP